MIKSLFAVALLPLFAALPCGAAGTSAEGSVAPTDSVAYKVVVSTFTSPGAGRIPSEIRIRSAVGEVLFLHRKHIEDRSLQCVTCHHQINAKKLETPHPDYLASSWINCKTCHDGSAKRSVTGYACSGCHRTNTRNVADETLSAKVVIHKQCWQCHAVGRGAQASAACKVCHSAEKAS